MLFGLVFVELWLASMLSMLPLGIIILRNKLFLLLLFEK